MRELKSDVSKILGIKGWYVMAGGVELEDDGRLVLSIVPESGRGYCCSNCGALMLIGYDHMQTRMIRDFPWAMHSCYLSYTPARVHCSACGKILVERLDWLDPNARHTIRYEKYIALLCTMMSATDVADLEGLDKGTVYRIDKKWLERREELMPDRPVTRLGIDEIALRKGHKYATVFYDLDRREVIGLVQGRSAQAVRRFFRRWNKKKLKGVLAVCMDLWAPYRQVVRQLLKNAEIVFDKFHVYKYLSDAIDTVRREEQQKADEETGRVLKGARWVILKAKANLTGKQKASLAEIMRLNRSLARACVLKEEFALFYASETIEEAQAFLKRWTANCKKSRLEPFIKLARRLNRHAAGILAYFRHRITNGVAEGINNLIKVIKRRAYGYSDFRYFFLIILDATGTLPEIDLRCTHPQF